VSDTDVLVRIAGDLGSIELVGVDIYSGSTRVGANTFYGDHGVTALHLAPGTYELLPFALNSTAIASSIDYKVEITVDNRDCIELTSGGHAEGSGANDVIAFPSSAPPMLTPATDSPETTNITLGASARISGTASDIASQDNYEDRDTFAFATDSSTNEATVKLVGDVDFFVFEANSAEPLVRATESNTSVFPLKRGGAYWLTIGAKTGTAGLPISYSATLCGASY
jgi:hypothetical protein